VGNDLIDNPENDFESLPDIKTLIITVLKGLHSSKTYWKI